MKYHLQKIFFFFILHVFFVFVKSEKPQCQAPVLVQQGTAYHIKVVCTAQNDYPEGDCKFTNKGLPADATFDKTVRHPGSTASTGSYTTECELLVSVEGLDEGSYQFQVEVFPSPQSQVTALSTFSEWTSGILLNHTRVALAQNCPSGTRVKDGYIMTGTTASCRCQVKLAGYPPGYAQWYTSDGNAVGTSYDDSSSILSLDNGSEGKTYYCTAKSVLKLPQTGVETQFQVPYSPKFAVGPKLVDVGWLPTAFDMCAQAGQSIRLRCGVSSNQVKPSPRLTLVIDDEIVKTGWNLAYNEYKKGMDYELLYHHIPTYGGNLRFLCRAENEIFPDELRTERDEIIPIKGPPKEALVLKTSDNQPITGSDIAYVGAGSDVFVTCRGNGGVPEVERVTIVCGTFITAQEGSSATLSLQLPNDFSGMDCTCSASYILDCYGERTQIIKLLPKGSESDDDDDGSNGGSIDIMSIGLGVGIGLAFLLIIVGVILCVLHYKRRDTKRPPSPSVSDSRSTSITSIYNARYPRGTGEDHSQAPLRESEYLFLGMPVLSPSEASFSQQSQFNMSVLNPSEVSKFQQSLFNMSALNPSEVSNSQQSQFNMSVLNPSEVSNSQQSQFNMSVLNPSEVSNSQQSQFDMSVLNPSEVSNSQQSS